VLAYTTFAVILAEVVQSCHFSIDSSTSDGKEAHGMLLRNCREDGRQGENRNGNKGVAGHIHSVQMKDTAHSDLEPHKQRDSVTASLLGQSVPS